MKKTATGRSKDPILAGKRPDGRFRPEAMGSRIGLTADQGREVAATLREYGFVQAEAQRDRGATGYFLLTDEGPQILFR